MLRKLKKKIWCFAVICMILFTNKQTKQNITSLMEAAAENSIYTVHHIITYNELEKNKLIY